MDVLKKTKELIAKAEEDKRKKEEEAKQENEIISKRVDRLRNTMIETFEQFDGFNGMSYVKDSGVVLEKNGKKIIRAAIESAKLSRINYIHDCYEDYYAAAIVCRYRHKGKEEVYATEDPNWFQEWFAEKMAQLCKE